MAHRIENAKAGFAQNLIEHHGLSKADAERVTGYYLKEKIAKIDVGIGRMSVKHGAFLDPDVIARAVSLSKGA